MKWVLRVKTDKEGKLEKFKARVVARGFNQMEGVDFEETESTTLIVALIITHACSLNCFAKQQCLMSNQMTCNLMSAHHGRKTRLCPKTHFQNGCKLASIYKKTNVTILVTLSSKIYSSSLATFPNSFGNNTMQTHLQPGSPRLNRCRSSTSSVARSSNEKISNEFGITTATQILSGSGHNEWSRIPPFTPQMS